MADDALSIWTVYDHPRDFPNSFIARRFELGPDGEPFATPDIVLAETLEKVRRPLIDAGLSRLDRNALDDPAIVETWL